MKTAAPLLAGLAGIFLAGVLNIPGGTFTGAMAGAAAVKIIFSGVKAPPRPLQNFSRIVLGLSIGITVNRSTLIVISRSLLPVLLMIGGLIMLTYLTAKAVTRVTGMPFTTSLCGAAPGAASAMVILADDLGGDSALVAVLHILRITAIVIFMPVFMAALQSRGMAAFPAAAVMPALTEAAGSSSPLTHYAKLAFLLVGGLPVMVLFRRWKIPAAEIMAGIFLAAAANPILLRLEGLPPLWQTLSMWVIGVSIGSQMNRESLKSMKAYTVASLVMTAVLIGIGFLLGGVLYLTTSMDFMTAMIGSCPGGLESMIILSGEMNANVPLVAAMHTARLVIVLLVVPFLVRRAVRPAPAAGLAG